MFAFVAHLDLPKSVEAYYQETGRAGRDGLPANAWMAYGIQDVITLRQLLESSEADETHKRIERHKLEAMLGLCEITTCRRQALLGYFVEHLPEPCGNCDNCLVPPETWDGTEASQKALSCVLPHRAALWCELHHRCIARKKQSTHPTLRARQAQYFRYRHRDEYHRMARRVSSAGGA